MRSLEKASTEELFGNLDAILKNMQTIKECCANYRSALPEGVLRTVGNTYTAHLYELAKRSVELEKIGEYFMKWEQVTYTPLEKK